MEIILKKKPKNCVMIQGFPGVGLVGSIAAEFLLEHLKVEQIGKITADDMPAMIAVHQGKMVDPFGIFYCAEHNLIIVHAVAATHGIEWKLGKMMLELAEKLEAKEIISLEGIAGPDQEEFKTFFFSQKNAEKLQKAGLEEMKEGVVIGVTAALLVESTVPVTCIFSETHSNLPDSKAAAKIIEDLDKYLGLKIDYAPLLKQAESFEQKLHDLLKQGQEVTDLSEKKRMSYVG